MKLALEKNIVHRASERAGERGRGAQHAHEGGVHFTSGYDGAASQEDRVIARPVSQLKKKGEAEIGETVPLSLPKRREG